MAAGKSHFRGLDGLRAFAALLVLVFHVVVRTERSGLWGESVDLFGTFGVGLFFILSGFLLYRPFVRAHLDGGTRPDTLAYMRRRLFRIVPVYWVVLAVGLLFFSSEVQRPDSFFGYLVLFGFAQLYSIQLVFAGLQVAWTLSVEISFYLLIPALAWLMNLAVRRGSSADQRYRVELALLFFLGLIGVGFRTYFFYGPVESSLPRFWLPAQLDWFAAGMILATLTEWRRLGGSIPRPIQLLANRPWMSWVLALELFWVATQFGRRLFNAPTGAQEILLPLVMVLCGTFVILPEVLGDRSSVGLSVLRSQLAVFLGAVSYGIYLVHLPIRDYFTRNQPESWMASTWGLLTVMLVLSVAIAWLLHIGVEKPAQRLGQRRTLTTPDVAALEKV